MKVHITVTDENGNNYEGITDLVKTKAKVSTSKKMTQPQQAARKVPQVIHGLYLKEYFKEEKSLADVVKKLGQMRYNFKQNTVRMALERADYLTNKGNRIYVEKYPPS